MLQVIWVLKVREFEKDAKKAVRQKIYMYTEERLIDLTSPSQPFAGQSGMHTD